MPLSSSILETEIKKIIDQNYNAFAGFPSDTPDMADKWSQAVNTYASAVVPPSVNSSLATTAMKSVLLTISNATPTGLTIFSASVLAYATSLGLGMQPGFTATPPPSPLDILLATLVASGFAGADSATIATQMATAIDGWFKTGIAINNASSISAPWS